MTNLLRDRSALWRLLVVAAAGVLAFTGCQAVMPGAIGGGGPGGPATLTGTGPGVTDTTVKVVFVSVDVSSIGLFNTASAGDPEKQVRALEAYVNANGGIAGRKMEAVLRIYNAVVDSPAEEEKLCNQVTQDDKAFAVVLTGQFQSNARPCYAQRRTLMLDATLVANDQQALTELSPYLWSPAYPSYDEFVSAFVDTLNQQQFFAGVNQVGVVAADTPTNRRTYDSIAQPKLDALSLEASVVWIDTTDLGTLNAGLNQAAIDFRTRGIERVFFLGGARMAPFFMTVATAQSFTARYGISSFDNPSFFVNNPDTIPAEVLPGMIGLGFNAAQDVPDSQYAFPATDAEKKCVEIFAAGGETFATRENARFAFAYCDAALLLHAGAKDLGADLNAAAWSQAVRALGDTFTPASGFDGQLGEGRFSASSAYRVLGFDTGCACFRYLSEDVPFASR